MPIKMGVTARIRSLPESPPSLVSRCHAMGFYPGVAVKVARIAPMGCPIVLDVEASHQVCIRRDELAAFEFEVV